ncbi:hypothetical protein BaRGS_00010667, partial [Batillaria attramentaria]
KTLVGNAATVTQNVEQRKTRYIPPHRRGGFAGGRGFAEIPRTSQNYGSWKGRPGNENSMRGFGPLRGGKRGSPKKMEGQIQCYRCQAVGHKAKDCTANEQQSNLMQCFRCLGFNHRARDCTAKEPVYRDTQNPNRQENKDENTLAKTVGNVATTDACDLSDLELIDGCVNGFHIVVMKDSGATTAGIRRSLVQEGQYTGQKQIVRCFGHTQEFEIAKVYVESEYFTGELDCCVLDDPVVDLIIGRIKGKTVLDSRLQEVVADVAVVGDLRAAAPAVTRQMAAREKQDPVPLKGTDWQLQVNQDQLIQMQKDD